MTDTRCTCGHEAQIHVPGGDISATTERGHGECTARCICDRYVARQHPSVIELSSEAFDRFEAELNAPHQPNPAWARALRKARRLQGP